MVPIQQNSSSLHASEIVLYGPVASRLFSELIFEGLIVVKLWAECEIEVIINASQVGKQPIDPRESN